MLHLMVTPNFHMMYSEPYHPKAAIVLILTDQSHHASVDPDAEALLNGTYGQRKKPSACVDCRTVLVGNSEEPRPESTTEAVGWL